MDEEERKLWGRLIFGVITLLVVGTVFYRFQEGFTWIDSLYFTVITLTTVGYGDFSPQTDLGKLFTVVFIVLGIGLFSTFISFWTKHRIHKKTEKKEQKNNKKK